MCFKNKESFDTVLKKYFSEPYTLDSVQPMRELFQSLKRTNFEVFLAYLKNNEEIKNNFRDYLFILFSNKCFTKALTDANILSENAFFPELKKRISYKFLPPVEDENTVSYIISFLGNLINYAIIRYKLGNVCLNSIFLFLKGRLMLV